MAKRNALTAPQVAYMLNLTPPAKTATGNDIEYGIKARVGQYTVRYVRQGFLPEPILNEHGHRTNRTSKGRAARYKRDNGTEGVLDLSAVINARR